MVFCVHRDKEKEMHTRAKFRTNSGILTIEIEGNHYVLWANHTPFVIERELFDQAYAHVARGEFRVREFGFNSDGSYNGSSKPVEKKKTSTRKVSKTTAKVSETPLKTSPEKPVAKKSPRKKKTANETVGTKENS